MFNKFQTYFNTTPNIVYSDSKDAYTNFMDMFDGQTFNKGLFRVIKKEEVSLWKEKIHLAFPKYIDKIKPFAFDWSGRFYCVSTFETAVYMFDIGYNKAIINPVDLVEFLEEDIASNPNTTLSLENFSRWITENIHIEYNYCLGFINPVFLGGEYQLENIQITHVGEYWSLLTTMLEQIPYSDKLLDHYENFFGIDYEGIKIEDSDTTGLSEDFCVVKFLPTQHREIYVYATLGLSNKNDTSPIELFMYSITENDRIVSILYEIAQQRNDKAITLEAYQTVEFKQPWYEGSKCDYGLISPPYIEGPELEECGNINCFWLIPLTQEEVQFKMQFGIESLEQKFNDAELNFLHYYRDSIV